MFRWIPYAFVRIVFFFCAGVLWSINGAYLLSNSLAWKLFAIAVALFFILTFFRNRLLVNPGIPGLAAIFLGGFLNVQLHTSSRSDDHLCHLNSSLEYYRGIVTSTPQEKDGFWKMEVSSYLGRTNGDWRQVDGTMILYLHRDSQSRPLKLGDELLVKGKPQPVAPPKNPGEFNYKQFLEFKNIYHQHFVTPNEVLVLGNSPPGVLSSLANDTRSKAVGILKKYISGEREQAMALALILGVKDDLDPEVRDAYAASGAMHVLAVSGLHVGIIYWLILMLAKPFRKGPTSRWIIAVISLLVLWSYAMVTGLSPSVMRAVTMFSFFSVARAWDRKTNVYNVLAASAFCLLLYNPHFIMSVGFQLSYLAVIGIVTLQPRLYRLWEPRRLIWDHVWKISTVAIAAQLATFPLGIFYFNQFPNYFLLSNIVVIPGAFMVLVGGILLLGASFSSPMAGIVGEMLGWIIKGINAMIFGIERLPWSHVENIYIDSFQCILIIGIVAMGYLFFEYRKSFYLISTAAAVVTLSFSMWIHYVRVVTRPTVTIYDVPGHTAIDFAQYGKVQFIADKDLMGDVSKAEYFIRPNHCRLGIQKSLTSDSLYREFEGCTIFAWQNRTILRIHSPAFRIPNELKVDYVIVSNDAVQSLDSIVDSLQTKEIILDSSNSFYRTKSIMAESENLSVPVFSVRHQGAFTIKI